MARCGALESSPISFLATPVQRPLRPHSAPTYLGTPAGAREHQGGRAQRDQGKPLAWRVQGTLPQGRTWQEEAQELGPATQAGLGTWQGLGILGLDLGDLGGTGERWAAPPQRSAGHTHAPKLLPATPQGGCRNLSPAPSSENIPAPPRPAASAPCQAPPVTPGGSHPGEGGVPLAPRALLWASRVGDFGAMGGSLWYLCSSGMLCTCNQVSSTGGGMGMVTVVLLMSLMMLSASFSAWCVCSISSCCCACSANSSISVFWFHQCVLVPTRVHIGQWLRDDELRGLRVGKQGRRLGPGACAALAALLGPSGTVRWTWSPLEYGFSHGLLYRFDWKIHLPTAFSHSDGDTEV